MFAAGRLEISFEMNKVYIYLSIFLDLLYHLVFFLSYLIFFWVRIVCRPINKLQGLAPPFRNQTLLRLKVRGDQSLVKNFRMLYTLLDNSNGSKCETHQHGPGTIKGSMDIENINTLKQWKFFSNPALLTVHLSFIVLWKDFPGIEEKLLLLLRLIQHHLGKYCFCGTFFSSPASGGGGTQEIVNVRTVLKSKTVEICFFHLQF